MDVDERRAAALDPPTATPAADGPDRVDPSLPGPRLHALLSAPEHGGPYAADLVEDALAILVLSSPGGVAGPDVAGLLGRCAERAGVQLAMAPTERSQTLQRYLGARSFPAGLVAALDGIVTSLSDGAQADAVRTFARFTAAARAPAGPKPGAISGPLARQQANAAFDARRPPPPTPPGEKP